MEVKDDEEFRTMLSDGYEFWLSLMNQVPGSQSNQSKDEEANKQNMLK